MTRYEAYDPLADASESVEPEFQQEINKDVKFLNQVQAKLIDRYCATKEGGLNNLNYSAWVNAFGKNFREHFVNLPTAAVLLRKLKHADSQDEEDKILDEIEDELYSPEGIFGLPKIES